MAGMLCQELVFVVADGRLKDDEFHVFPVAGLSSSNTDGAQGFIVFSQTRCPPKGFFVWLNKNVIFPFINRLQANYKGTGNSNCFVFCDGEADQIYPYFDEAMMHEMDRNDIIVGKLPASSTSITQPCDSWKLFSSCKACYRVIPPSEVECETGMNGNVADVLVAYNRDVHKNASGGPDKKRTTAAIVKAVIAIRRTMDAQIIKNSFKVVGVNANVSLNLTQMLHQFSVQYKTAEYYDIQANIVEGRKFFRKNGRITDKELYDTFDIVKRLYKDQGTPKDELALYRQRCVLLNHAGTVSRFEAVIQAKVDAELAAVLAKQQKVEKKAAREAEAAAKKLLKEQKEEEKLRRAMEGGPVEPPRKKKKVNTICICKVPVDYQDDKLWVQCSKAGECKFGCWFHYECLGYDDLWVCPDIWTCAECSKL